MSKHTPGPWRFEQGIRYDDLKKLIGGNGEEICFFGNEEPYEQTAGFEPEEADMRLIAAAPDLLEALNGILERYTGLVNCGDCGDWDCEKEQEVVAARSAIASAKGESK